MNSLKEIYEKSKAGLIEELKKRGFQRDERMGLFANWWFKDGIEVYISRDYDVHGIDPDLSDRENEYNNRYNALEYDLLIAWVDRTLQRKKEVK